MKNSIIYRMPGRDACLGELEAVTGKHIYTIKEKEQQLSIWRAYLLHLSLMQAELDKSRSKSHSRSKGPSRVGAYIEGDSRISNNSKDQLYVQLRDNEIIIGKHRKSEDYINSPIGYNRVNTENLNSNRNGGVLSESDSSVHSLLQN